MSREAIFVWLKTRHLSLKPTENMNKEPESEQVSLLKILFIRAIKEILENQRDEVKAVGNMKWSNRHIYQKWLKDQEK